MTKEISSQQAMKTKKDQMITDLRTATTHEALSMTTLPVMKQ